MDHSPQRPLAPPARQQRLGMLQAWRRGIGKANGAKVFWMVVAGVEIGSGMRMYADVANGQDADIEVPEKGMGGPGRRKKSNGRRK